MPTLTLLSVPFAFVLGGFVFAGVLGPLAEDLGVSLSAAGALQAVYALGCALAGPVLAHLTRNRRKKPLLLATLAAMTLLNIASLLAPDFPSLLVLRLAIGITGALSLPLAVAFAVSLVAPEARPRAIARVYSGVAYALMLGVPLGSLVGSWFGWRASFAVAALAAAAALLLVARNVPNLPAQPVPPGGSRMTGQTAALLGVTYLAFAAMFALVGYIGPVITALTGAGGPGAALFQTVVGLSCLAGLILGARMAARSGQSLPWLFVGMIAGLLVLVPPLMLEARFAPAVLALAASAAVAPLCQFATAPVVQSRLAIAAGPSATFLLSLNGSMVYLGQGSGVLLGGLAIEAGGLAAAPLVGAMVAVLGLLLSASLRVRTHQSHPFQKDAET